MAANLHELCFQILTSLNIPGTWKGIYVKATEWLVSLHSLLGSYGCYLPRDMLNYTPIKKFGNCANDGYTTLAVFKRRCHCYG